MYTIITVYFCCCLYCWCFVFVCFCFKYARLRCLPLQKVLIDTISNIAVLTHFLVRITACPTPLLIQADWPIQGPYLPCVSMAGRALLAGYHRHAIVNYTITGSENGLSPVWCQSIIWINTGVWSIVSLGTNFNEMFKLAQTTIWAIMNAPHNFCLS